MSYIHKVHLAIIASVVRACLGVEAYLEAVSQLVCVHVPYVDLHIVTTRHQHGILVTEREERFVRLCAQLPACMLSMYTDRH